MPIQSQRPQPAGMAMILRVGALLPRIQAPAAVRLTRPICTSSLKLGLGERCLWTAALASRAPGALVVFARVQRLRGIPESLSRQSSHSLLLGRSWTWNIERPHHWDQDLHHILTNSVHNVKIRTSLINTVTEKGMRSTRGCPSAARFPTASCTTNFGTGLAYSSL